MATREKLEEKTVAELKELAGEKGVPGRWTMNKDELIDALADDNAPREEATPKTSTEPSPDYRPEHPISGMTIKGEGKSGTRLYQTSPECKEYLTEDEAKEKGFYWAKSEDEKGKAKKK